MRADLINEMKLEIEKKLKTFLHEEGMELYIAANDNFSPPAGCNSRIILEALESMPLEGYKLLSEIRVKLGIFSKSWQCDTLVDGIYQALHPHHFTLSELTVLLMSFHIDPLPCKQPRKLHKRAVMRYIVEETT